MEEIIIDDVDVSKCEFLLNNVINKVGCGITADEYGYDSIKCKKFTDCYYKQLKRKEQECEELKEKLIISEKIRDEKADRIVELNTKNIEYKQALQKIKKLIRDVLSED